MSKFFTAIGSMLKREKFVVDENIPTSYLRSFFFRKLIDYFRGILIFKKPFQYILVGYNSQIICKSKIKCGRSIKFSENCYVDALSRNGIILGNNFSLGRYASIECTGSLSNLGAGFYAGNNVGIGSFSFLGCAGGIFIGDDTITGNFVSMHSENHIYTSSDFPIRTQGVTHKGIHIGKNCWIGAKATILDGAFISDNVIVAAGAVVKEGFYESNSIFGGVPAIKLKSIF